LLSASVISVLNAEIEALNSSLRALSPKLINSFALSIAASKDCTFKFKVSTSTFESIAERSSVLAYSTSLKVA
jgi:hypothetical protein